jgi:hypothetical protein
MTFFPKTLKIFGYASLCPDDHFCEFDCDKLGDFAKTISGRMDTIAEELHPSERRRPYFNEIRKLISTGKVDLLVVPSLFHIAAGEKERMAKFLKFLGENNVRLMSLKEKIDTQYLNDAAILNAVKGSYPSKCPAETNFNS